MPNLKQYYKNYEKPSLRVFVREKDWSPNFYTVATKDLETITLKNLYFKVIYLLPIAFLFVNFMDFMPTFIIKQINYYLIPPNAKAIIVFRVLFNNIIQ